MSNISAYSKAIFAFVALVSIQVSVGLIYKLAASGNDGYQFSRASALAMSELFKLFVSFVLYASQKQKLPETSYFQHVHFIFLSLFSEVPFRIAAGMVSLSVFYLFNNHLAFYLFSQADPGTINLVKSGSTFFTATMLWIALSRKTSKIQWLAITIQLFALISSQVTT
ncbi:hypothetical protein BC833DRAFT_598985 [Globomyces pollinis-pini]|nr:hypothetical protein BC833DRAFT_598985 [Globomyces pollinis-pini]